MSARSITRTSMLDRKSASEEPEDLPPEEEEPPCPAEAAPPRSLGSSASLVARAMGEATMMSDWKRSEKSLRGGGGAIDSGEGTSMWEGRGEGLEEARACGGRGRGGGNRSETSLQAGIQGETCGRRPPHPACLMDSRLQYMP